MRPGLRRALFVVETCGLAAVLYFWVPLYRRLAGGPVADHPGSVLAGPLLPVIVLMQACYWVRQSLPAATGARRPVLGHLLLFLSRLTFVFAGSTFSVFLVRAGDTRPTVAGLTVALAGLFAIFCYSFELERLGRHGLDAPVHGYPPR